jgi:hypothetical protein
VVIIKIKIGRWLGLFIAYAKFIVGIRSRRPTPQCTIIEDEDILWEDGDAATENRIDISVKDKCPTFMFSRKYSTSLENANNNNQNSDINKDCAGMPRYC